MSYVIWFTGVSGAGKSTLANGVLKALEERGVQIELLDGDIVRDFFENDLGYSRPERELNVRRIAFAANLLSKHGVTVLVANIAPYYSVRDFIRRKIPKYIQIYVKSSQQIVAKRDVKGYYAKVGRGEMENMVGVDDAYEEPRQPDFVVETDCESVEQSVGKIMSFLDQKEIFQK